jgi:hypothetical protein
LRNVDAKGSQELGVMATNNAGDICRKSFDYLEVTLSIVHGVGIVVKRRRREVSRPGNPQSHRIEWVQDVDLSMRSALPIRGSVLAICKEFAKERDFSKLKTDCTWMARDNLGSNNQHG